MDIGLGAAFHWHIYELTTTSNDLIRQIEITSVIILTSSYKKHQKTFQILPNTFFRRLSIYSDSNLSLIRRTGILL